MRKRFLFIAGTAAILFLAGFQSSYAVGVGLNLSGGAVYSTYATTEEFMSGGEAASVTEYVLGFGLVIDTAVAKDKVFNYRFQIGYDNLTTSDFQLFDQFSYHRILWDNTFGFAPVRKKNFRFWLGPMIGLSYEFTGSNEYAVLFGHFGPVIGFNINPGNVVTISIEIGARIGIGGPIEAEGEAIAFKVEGFGKLGVLFRINDTYSGG